MQATRVQFREQVYSVYGATGGPQITGGYEASKDTTLEMSPDGGVFVSYMDACKYYPAHLVMCVDVVKEKPAKR